MLNDSRPTALDLFCGAGGLSLGLAQAGFRVLAGVDAWEPAVRSYRLNFKHSCISADLSRVTPEELCAQLKFSQVDLIAGGPPCQGFSIQRIGSDSDLRNDLVLKFADSITAVRPRAFLMENVPGLLGKRGAPVLAELKLRMQSAGYVVWHRIVDAAHYGVPQHRRRVFVVGICRDLAPYFVFPAATHDDNNLVTVRAAIGDLQSPRPKAPTALVSDNLHFRTRLSSTNLERLRHVRPGRGFEDLPASLRVNCHKKGADKIGHRYVYGRLAFDEPAGTITARFDSFTRGKFAHPEEDRNITLREGARLQTFPDEFRFAGTQEEIAALIGNAIPPKLALILGKSLKDCLTGTHVETDSSALPPLFSGRVSQSGPENLVNEPASDLPAVTGCNS